MSEERNEVVEIEREDTPLILKEADARATMMNTMVKNVVKACHQRNIIDMGGNPYIDDDGCQKIARVVGVSYSSPEIKEGYEDNENGQKEYVVEVSGEATLLGQTIYEFGACTSNDGFISKRGNLSSLQMKIEIKKKAICNWRGRCVRSLLGLKELTWKELQSVGFSQDNASKVDYKQGKSSGKSDDGNDARKKIGNMLLDDCKGDRAAAGELLEVLTTFENKDGKTVKGKSSAKDLTDKQAGFTWGKIKPGGQERKEYELQLAEVLRNYGITEGGE